MQSDRLAVAINGLVKTTLAPVPVAFIVELRLAGNRINTCHLITSVGHSPDNDKS
jgi:hypothetical protein